MAVSGIMAVVLSLCAMIGVYFLILYFKIDNIEYEVHEIKRKIELKQIQSEDDASHPFADDVLMGGD